MSAIPEIFRFLTILQIICFLTILQIVRYWTIPKIVCFLIMPLIVRYCTISGIVQYWTIVEYWTIPGIVHKLSNIVQILKLSNIGQSLMGVGGRGNGSGLRLYSSGIGDKQRGEWRCWWWWWWWWGSWWSTYKNFNFRVIVSSCENFVPFHNTMTEKLTCTFSRQC